MDTIKKYDKGYYKYAVTITFRDDTPYVKCNPAISQREFKQVFTTYLNKRNIKYKMWPEISKTGRFHYHGFIMFKCESIRYQEHDRDLRLTRNYFNRKFGRQEWQQILSYTEPYDVTSLRFYTKNHTLKTDFTKVYEYTVKEASLFPYLKVISNIDSEA